MKKRKTARVLLLVLLLYTAVLPIVYCNNSQLRVSDTANAEPEIGNSAIALHVLMYHNLLKSRSGKYITSPDDFESDIKEIRRRGYEFVSPSEVISYAEGKGTLPQKAVMLTFDDGRYNNVYYGLPILERNDAKALFCIVGAFTEFTVTSGDIDNPNYSHITWEELKYLQDTGRVEIGNHTYNMHKYKPRFGIGRLPGESDAEYRLALDRDISALQSKFAEYGIKAEVFSYPFGKITGICKEVLVKNGIKMTLTCTEGVSTVTKGDPSTLVDIKRYNRDGGYTTEQALNKAGIV